MRTIYDGLERLAVRVTQNMTPSETTHYIYDLNGHIIVEASGTGATVREYIKQGRRMETNQLIILVEMLLSGARRCPVIIT